MTALREHGGKKEDVDKSLAQIESERMKRDQLNKLKQKQEFILRIKKFEERDQKGLTQLLNEIDNTDAKIQSNYRKL